MRRPDKPALLNRLERVEVLNSHPLLHIRRGLPDGGVARPRWRRPDQIRY